ncbi:MAG: putative metal-binding motif-containing protein, partial [Myxococcota bacterium]
FAQGVAIYADLTAGRLTVRQNTFGANANNYDGTIVSAFGGDVTMLANLFVDNLHGVFSVETLPGASFGANAGLAPGDLPPFDPTPQLLRERPRFVVETAGRRQPAACRDVGPWLLAPRAAENQILLDEGLGAMTRDEDGDGFVGVEDCDDGDPDIFPGAQEVAGDGVDTDCDGLEVCYVDADGDGWGGPFGVGLDWYCLREGLTTRRGDCDDADPEVSPDGLEIAYDGIDQDCRDGDLVDVDGDGSDWPEDCDDEDPTYARCAGYLAGVACQSGPPAPAGLGLLGLVVAFTQGRRRGARSPRSGRRRGAIG